MKQLNQFLFNDTQMIDIDKTYLIELKNIKDSASPNRGTPSKSR